MTIPELKRGQAISFRIPSDTPDYILKQLQKLKETEGRNFSRKIAQYVLEGVSESLNIEAEKEIISLPLPQALTEDQRDWIKHEHSEIILGAIISQLLDDPERTVALLNNLNSQSHHVTKGDEQIAPNPTLEKVVDKQSEDDIAALQLDLKTSTADPFTEEAEDLLGDFLNEMNK